MIPYEQAVLVTQSTPMVIMAISAWLIPLLIFTFLALVISKKTSSGNYKIHPLISSGSLIWAWVIWGLLGALLTALWIFPIFLKINFLSSLF